MWVVLSIYLTVIGWAYAIGALLALVQGRAFKAAIAAQRFRRAVVHLREPFWLMAGHGQTGALLGTWLDDLGKRFVVIDQREEAVDSLDLGSYGADVPALVADVRNPEVLVQAGLTHPSCAGVLALTDDDEANLAVTMSASVLRPDLPVIARSTSRAITTRMRAFGNPTVIDPFDRFGDHFTIAMDAPASEQLTDWLTRAPGAPLPEQHPRIRDGLWIVYGYGRFGREMTRDLRREGVEVQVIDIGTGLLDDPEGADDVIVGDATNREVLERARVEQAVGFIAGTDNDITNLSLVQAARRAENEFVGVPCGILDQAVSGFGRKDHLVFIDCRGPRIEAVPLPAEAHFWIFNTHTRHALVDGLYAARNRECLAAARALGVAQLADATPGWFAARAGGLGDVEARRARHVIEEIARVDAAMAALRAGDLAALGRLLTASHGSSRRWFENSTAELDFLVDTLAAMPHVHGARLTGGGFGGAVLALTDGVFGAAAAEGVAAAYAGRFGARPEVLHARRGAGAELLLP